MLAKDSTIDSGMVCEAENVKDSDMSALKLDAHGVPLVPQPSDHRDDPLVGTRLLQYLRLVC